MTKANNEAPHYDAKPVSVMSDVLLALDAKRAQIEIEMGDIVSVLQSEAFSNIGISKPLVDAEGYPLSGIDLHQVRTLRNRFAILRTDLQSLTTEIEKHLLAVHENARSSGSVSRGEHRSLKPFGRVEMVTPNSPADIAGLIVGDKILRFGPLSCTSDDGVDLCYDSVPTLVRNSEPDSNIQVQVQRIGRDDDTIILGVQLVDGKLGCLIKRI
jgi:26S proteasome non-ATPase regulatory subunit 9